MKTSENPSDVKQEQAQQAEKAKYQLGINVKLKEKVEKRQKFK